MSRRMKGLGWLLTPVLFGAAILVILPALGTLILAFTHYDGLTAPRAAGLENFRRMGADHIFLAALRASLIFAALAVPLRALATLGAGLLLSPPRRGVVAARTAVSLPTFVPEVAYALVWLWVFNPLYGPLGAAMRAIGLPGTAWLLGPWGARLSLVIMSIFTIAESVIVVVAVRNEIPSELYDAAAVEGAGRLHTFRTVTAPVVLPALALLAARDVAFTFQATFVPALIVTKGGPEYATTVLPLYAYQNAFEFLRFGYAAAMTVIMFALTAVVIAVQALVLRRWKALLAS